MQDSPYTPGDLARDIPGRETQVGEIAAALRRLERYGELGGRIRVDVGPRGVGKTSLLREVQRQADAMGLATVFVTAGDGALVTQLSEGLRLALGARELGVHVDSLVAKVNVAIAGVEAKLVPKSGQAPPTAPAFRELVAAAGRQARRFDHRGLVLLVDELQAADALSIRTVAYAWQELQATPDRAPAILLATGLSHTQDVVTDAVSFGERFAFRPMHDLDDVAVRHALTAPAADLGVTWDRSLVEEVVQRTQGYPYFVQVFADSIWRAAGNPDPGGALLPEHLVAAEEAIELDRTNLFRGRWSQATPKEQEVMAAIAQHDTPEVARSAIATTMGVRSADLGMVRRSLMDKGLVHAPRYGYLAFTVPGFDAYVRRYSDG